jgi:hypothetical protein
MRQFLDHYKGRIGYTEAANMPMRDFQTLYYLIYLDAQADGGKSSNAKAMAETLEEALET